MKQGLTEIICVIDKSASMCEIRNGAIEGFNKFLDLYKRLEGDIRITLALFSSGSKDGDLYQMVCDNVQIHNVQPLSRNTYRPAGYTALYDALGRTILKVGKRLYLTPEEEQPERIMMVILTDGVENNSTVYTLAEIKTLIKNLSEKYRWEFLFLAANVDAERTAKKINIPSECTMRFENSSRGITHAFQELSEKTLELLLQDTATATIH